MDVRIYFQEMLRTPHSLAQPPYDFLNHFGFVSLLVLEPRCPFCGNRLYNGKCDCREYHEALQNFLKGYENKGLNVQLFEFEHQFPVSLIRENIKLELVEANGDTDIAFDEGTKATRTGISSPHRYFWYVSEGLLKDDELSFLIRKHRSRDVYRCTVSKINTKVQVSDEISVFYNHRFTVPNPSGAHRMGGYHFQYEKKVIDTLPYSDFLQKLKPV